jgi:hypothetical protein
MFDKKVNKVFLKRIEVPNVKLEDFYVGSRVTIFSRVLEVKEYGDLSTKAKFSVER